MTLTELTPEAKRTLAAEACGWIVRHHPYGVTGEMVGWRKGNEPTSKRPHLPASVLIPDYGNDLNAMAEAEATLTDDEYGLLIRQLRLNADSILENKGTQKYQRAIIGATAAQRLDAFLLAKGLAT